MKNLFRVTLATRIALSFAVIILMFASVLVYVGFSYRNVEEYQRVRTDFIWARVIHLLELNTSFVELRLTISDTYFSESWIMSANGDDWEQLDYALRLERENFLHRSHEYMQLVRNDRFLYSGERMSRLVTMQSVSDSVDSLFDYLLDEHFTSALRARGESYEELRYEVSRRIEEIAISVESSMIALRLMAEESEAALYQHIERAIDRIILVVLVVVAAALALSILFARLVVKGVRKMAVEKTLDAQEENRLLLQSIPFALTMWKVSGTDDYELYSCNTKSLEFFEYEGTKEELLNDYHKFFPECQPDGTPTGELIGTIMEEAATHGQGKLEFYHLKASDGRLFPSEINFVKEYFMEQELIFVFAEDTTEIKEAHRKEQEEALLRRAVEEESRAKTKFLARMSHEIRTPLNAVLGITEIEMLKDTHSPQTEDAFLRIYNSSNLLLAIINDILDLSKVESGKMEIMSSDYEMASLIVDTVQLNLMHVGSKQLEFGLKVDETLPSHLVGDELRIKQILNNILSNAFKYTQEGSVHLTVSKEKAQTGVNLVFRVEDTGSGMTEDQVASLFNLEYTRFNIASNRSIEGTGLGMNIAHQLVTMMDGKIDVDSQVNRGTIITVTLPQLIYDERMIGKAVAKNLENLEVSQQGMRRINRFKRTPMPYGRVLVVDDVESNLFVAKGLLLPYKLSVETAISGPSAISMVKAGELFDVIFMDHMMPEMDGIEAVQIIRGLGYDLPIVALTANTVVGQSEIFMENGFDGFVSKPIDINLLNSYLMRFVRDRHPEEAQAIGEEGLGEIVDVDGNIVEGIDVAELPDSKKDIFIRDINNALVNISPVSQLKPLDGDGIKNYLVSTHSMKSVLSIIGEKELSEHSAQLEKAAKVILNETPGYLEELGKISSKLTALKKKSSYDDSDADWGYLKEQLIKIKEACESIDIGEAESIINNLLERAEYGKIEGILSDMSYQLLMGEYDYVVEKADELIAQSLD